MLHQSSGYQFKPTNMTTNNSPTMKSNKLNDSLLTTSIITPQIKLRDNNNSKVPQNEIKINLKKFNHLI